MTSGRIAFAFSVALLVNACAPMPERITHTSSGWPEITIPGVSIIATKPAIINRALDNGFRIVAESQSTITIAKQLTGPKEVFMRIAAGGNSYSTPAEIEIVYTIVNVKTGVRVIAHMSAFTRMAFGQINRTELNGNLHFNEVQADLQRLAEELTQP